MSRAKDITPRYITHNNLRDDTVDVSSIHVGFGNSSIKGIALEWGVDRSNAKDTTIIKGVQERADREVAERVVGHRFLVDRGGRNMAPFLGRFSQEVRDSVKLITPDGTNEFLYPQNQMLDPAVLEAVKYKIWLKQILLYSRLEHSNHLDGNLLTFCVTGQETGEGLVGALFQGGNENCDLYLSMTEITDFKFEENII